MEDSMQTRAIWVIVDGTGTLDKASALLFSRPERYFEIEGCKLCNPSLFRRSKSCSL